MPAGVRRAAPFDAFLVLLMAGVVTWLACNRRGVESPLADLPVAASLPVSVPVFWGVVILVAAPLAVLALRASFKRLSSWPIIACHLFIVLVLLVQLFFTPRLKLPAAASPEADAEIAMVIVATRIAALSVDGRLPGEASALDGVLAGLPPVGEGGEHWRLEPASCARPEDLPPKIEPGVGLYCLASDRSRAWLAWGAGGAAPETPDETPAFIQGVEGTQGPGSSRWVPIHPMR